MKDPRIKELKARTQKATSLHHPKNSKTSGLKDWTEKKKKYYCEQTPKNFKATLATSIIMIKANEKPCKDKSQISYYNCTKKGHYSTDYTALRKNVSKKE